MRNHEIELEARSFALNLYSLINVIHILLMQINFDEPKRQLNISKHGLDFADLDIEYFANSIVIQAKLGRFVAIGVLSNDVITTVFAKLGSQGLSIVSMRRASRKERKVYEQFNAQKTEIN
jgi:uncharacterized protein